MSLFNRRLEIEIESYINPQSAIRNPNLLFLKNCGVFRLAPVS
jgi:hypothetical protein